MDRMPGPLTLLKLNDGPSIIVSKSGGGLTIDGLDFSKPGGGCIAGVTWFMT